MLALHAGLAGLPLGIALLSWFFKYCFILLESLESHATSPVAGDDGRAPHTTRAPAVVADGWNVCFAPLLNVFAAVLSAEFVTCAAV